MKYEIKEPDDKPDDLNSVSGNHAVEEKSELQMIVL